jgi:hypothetical protein
MNAGLAPRIQSFPFQFLASVASAALARDYPFGKPRTRSPIMLCWI